jgi:shikimate 5-dehydrogenase
MLVYQGAIGFKLWTGKEAPVKVMKKALTDAFAGNK